MPNSTVSAEHDPPLPAQSRFSSEKIVQFLREKQADKTRHSGSTLLEHLEGVQKLLEDWGAKLPVVTAGLCHSLYGTEFFKRSTIDPASRSQFRALVGIEAERLVYLFGGMRSESLFSAIEKGPPFQLRTRWQELPIEIDEATLRDLATIIVANWIEQFPRLRGKARAARLETFKVLSTWLGGAPAEALNEIYGFGREPLKIVRQPLDPHAGLRAQIEVWDDAVPDQLQIQLAGLIDLNIWRYGWRATADQAAYGFWHSHFGGDDDHRMLSCEHDLLDRPLVAPVLELWRMLEAGPLSGQVPTRVYANGHTFGGDGHVHTDHDEPGHFTTIYYAHSQWDPNWAGETVFFNEARDDVIRAVFPKPGRLVHFPGRILHAARSPGRECPSLRAVIVFKSRMRRPED